MTAARLFAGQPPSASRLAEVALGSERRPDAVAVQLIKVKIGKAGFRLNELLNFGRDFHLFVLWPTRCSRHRLRLLIVAAALLIGLPRIARSARLIRAQRTRV